MADIERLLDEFEGWREERTELCEDEGLGYGVSSSAWQASDDAAFDLLERMAEALWQTAGYDTASSASRQHHIDTGKYLRVERVRLEEIRAEIRAERISYGELAELANLVEFIDPGDVELLEWAGVPEFPNEEGD
jgi:hypothetical protein